MRASPGLLQELTKSNSCSGGSKRGAIGTKLLPKNDTVARKAKVRDGERERKIPWS